MPVLPTVTTFPASEPLESVAAEVLRELIKPARGNQYLLIIGDRFTRLAKLVPLRSISACDVDRAFVNDSVFKYGLAKELISNNEKCYTAKLFRNVCGIRNINNLITTIYHPQTKRQVERYRSTVIPAISSYLSKRPKDQDL